jgi:hypothetical protein
MKKSAKLATHSTAAGTDLREMIPDVSVRRPCLFKIPYHIDKRR